MKKITFIIASIFTSICFAQTTYTEGFDTTPLNLVLQGGAVDFGLDSEEFSSIPTGDGEWYTVVSFGDQGFGIETSGGNPDNYVARVSISQFARAFAYVYNNTDASVTGSYDLSFDYFYNTSFDNSSATNERFGVRVWGLKLNADDTLYGAFQLSSGSGDFGDDNATNYNDTTEGIELLPHTHFAHTDSWVNSGNLTVDFGTAGDYDFIVVVFGQVFGTNQEGNPVATYFGVDNVVLPTQSNPQVLSTDAFAVNKLSIYPNPATDLLNIKNLEGTYSYKISDVTGKLIQSESAKKTNQIDIKSLKRGMYILEVVDNNDNKSISKIIKN